MATENKSGADYNFKSYSNYHLQFAKNDRLTAVIAMAWLDRKSWPLYGYIDSIQTLPKGTKKKDILSIVEKWKSRKTEYMNHTITDEEKDLAITRFDYEIALWLFDKIIAILEAHAGAMKEVHDETGGKLDSHRSEVSSGRTRRIKPRAPGTAPGTAPAPAPGTAPAPAPTPTPSPEPVQKVDIFKDSKTSVVFKEGAYYLTGPEGQPTRMDFETIAKAVNLPENAPENLKKSTSIATDFAEVLDAYLAKFPNKKMEHERAIKLVRGDFAQTSIQTGVDVLNIDKAIKSLPEIDNQALLDLFHETNPQTRHTKVLNFMRDELDQSDVTARSIMETKGQTLWIDDNSVMNEDLSNIKLTAEQRQSIEKTIDDAKIEAAKNWKEHKQDYIAAFQKEHPGVTVNSAEAENWNKKLTILAMTKREIFYQKLYNADQSDPELKLLQDILGAGTWDMSDRAKLQTGEIASLIATEAIAIAAGMVSVWAGTALVNTIAWMRYVAKGVELANISAKVGKVGQWTWTAGRIIGSGVAFEAGSATARSQMENGDWTSMHSKEGYVQSIAMMGALRGVGRLIESGKFGTGIQFKEWAGFGKNVIPFTGQVLLEGSAIFGVSGLTGSYMVDGRDNWTPEQLAQAVLMAALFKGKGRIKFWKDKEGNPVVTPEPPNPEPTGKYSLHSRSNTVDLDAQSRIDAEHGIGREKVEHGYGAETGNMEDVLNIWAGDHSLKGSPNKGPRKWSETESGDGDQNRVVAGVWEPGTTDSSRRNVWNFSGEVVDGQFRDIPTWGPREPLSLESVVPKSPETTTEVRTGSVTRIRWELQQELKNIGKVSDLGDYMVTRTGPRSYEIVDKNTDQNLGTFQGTESVANKILEARGSHVSEPVEGVFMQEPVSAEASMKSTEVSASRVSLEKEKSANTL